MNANDVQFLVSQALAEYSYQMPESGSTHGTPWTEEKVMREVEALKNALVAPYVHQFLLRDTYEQVHTQSSSTSQLWVVAHLNELCEFYDPETKEFGLAESPDARLHPSTIGVRGDLVGVFCAR